MGVDDGAPWRQELRVRDVADASVKEIEALSDHAEDPPADELLDRGGGVLGAEVAGLAQLGEIALTPDDGGDAQELTARRTQAIESSGDHVAHAFGHRKRAVGGGDHIVTDSAHGFDDDEWVARAERPDVLLDLGEPRRRRGRSDEAANERVTL